MSENTKNNIQYKTRTSSWVMQKITMCLKERRLPSFVVRWTSSGVDLKKILRLFIRSKNAQHAVALYTWPTKSYQVWLLLQNLLYLIRPQTIVEFGSGRSTYYLAEYMLKFKTKVISFEQHLFYYLKIKGGLRRSFLPSDIIKYAPLKGDWYDTKTVKKHLSFLDSIDFLFYDGPTAASKGDRTSQRFYSEIVPLLNGPKMMLIDDVHREKLSCVASDLAKRFGLKRYNVLSISDNTYLAFLLCPEAAEKVNELPGYLRLLLEPIE